MDLLTHLIVVIILQQMYASNHHNICLSHIQCYMSIISQQSWRKKFFHLFPENNLNPPSQGFCFVLFYPNVKSLQEKFFKASLVAK